MVSFNMKVSVVIPALNEEGIIEDCLQSIRRQDHPLELILVDNGSIDKTPEISRKFCDKVFIKPNYSLAEMRDFGASNASGDIIITTDADCIAPPGWATKLIKSFENPDVVAVGGGFRPLNLNPLSRFYCWISPIMQKLGLFQGANMAYRKEAYMNSEGYNKAKRAEDWHLSFNLGFVGKTKYVRGAYIFTEIPLNRQFEYPGVIISAILLCLGLLTGWLNFIGFGIGYIGSEALTFVYRYRLKLRRSHIALVALSIVWLMRNILTHSDWLLSIGTLAGIFSYHVISEDLRIAIEDLKMYKITGKKDQSLTGQIKQHLIRLIGL
jgi:glycosyltransferase involved in cell wall biosynthesis